MVLALLPLVTMVLAFALLETRDLVRLAKGLAIIGIPLGLFLLLGFKFTCVAIRGTVLTITKFFFFRNAIDVHRITALKYRAFGVTSLDGIEIEYANANGAYRKAVFGSIGAYGREQIADIVGEIVEMNPQVQLDKRVSSFL
jgi:hypothetical protein